MSDRHDEALLAAAGAGDRDAFNELVERYQRVVVQFVYRFLGPAGRSDAEDIAQEVFIRAWKHAARFEPRAKVLTWLLRIATNVSLNERRRRALRRAFGLEAVPEDAVSSSDFAPAADLEADDTAAEVRAALLTLPDKQRAAVVLRHYHDLSYAEIAETLKTSVSAVESLLFRARRSLQDRLAGGENPPQVAPTGGVQS